MIADQPVTSKAGDYIEGDIEQAADTPGQEGLEQFIARRNGKEQRQGETRRQRRENEAECAEEHDMRNLSDGHGTREDGSREGTRAENASGDQGPAW
jgi:hypothetical protein